MTDVTIRPIRDDLSFGARVGGVTADALAGPGGAETDSTRPSRTTGS